ncbi:radical SAM protein [Candidatus Woesearchaeota archaeon]|nr:radical SAM protein [Candidatus Woesearchaeota archaeon]
MAESKAYGSWLLWSATDACNLDCTYCFSPDATSRRQCPVRPIDSANLMRTLRRTGKTFHIVLTGGGEPFLVPNLVEACREITKEHYISVVTNMTSPHIREFASRVPPNRVVYVLASLHIKELERRDLMEQFLSNVQLLKKGGFPVLVHSVAYPPLSTEVKRIRRQFKERGLEFSFVEFQGTYRGKKYPWAYTPEELDRFGFGKEDLIITNHQKGRVCNAGYNAAVVDPHGDVRPCYQIHSMRLGNIYKGFSFRNSLLSCPSSSCPCPLHRIDRSIFHIAVRDCTKIRRLGLFFKMAEAVMTKIPATRPKKGRSHKRFSLA